MCHLCEILFPMVVCPHVTPHFYLYVTGLKRLAWGMTTVTHIRAERVGKDLEWREMKVKIADEVKQEERSFKDLSRIDSFTASQKRKRIRNANHPHMKTFISKCKITWFTGEKCIFWKSSLRQCFAEGGGYLKSFTNHWNVYSSYDNKGWFAGNTCRVFCSWEMTECDFWCFDVNNELKWVTLINVSLVSLVVLPGLKEKFLKFMNIWKDIFLFIIFINI